MPAARYRWASGCDGDLVGSCGPTSGSHQRLGLTGGFGGSGVAERGGAGLGASSALDQPTQPFARGEGGCCNPESWPPGGFAGPQARNVEWVDASDDESSASGSDSPRIEVLPRSRPAALGPGAPHIGHDDHGQGAEAVLMGALAKCEAWEAKCREELLLLAGHPGVSEQDLPRCCDLAGAIQSILAEKARIRDDLASLDQGSPRP